MSLHWAEARLADPGLTPMLHQYLSVKVAHPEAIVLFRMGDFYEAFFEDAEDCAERLNITLTSRSKEREVKMAGVPHHALDSYLARLIAQGQTVVIVDQVEDPKQAKGLVRREVTRVVSPGTYVDPEADPRAQNFLLAVALGKGKAARRAWGLAALELGTGEFRACRGEGQVSLLDELHRLNSKEILCCRLSEEDPLAAALSEALSGVRLSFPEGAVVGKDAGRAALSAQLGAQAVAAAEQALGPLAVEAAGAALSFSAHTQLHPEAPDLKGPVSLGHVCRLRAYQPGGGLGLDAAARTHLELFRTQREGARRGSLLWSIDGEVQSSMGGRLLAEWLAYPLQDMEAITARQEAVQALLQAPLALDRLREGMKGLPDIQRLMGRVVMGRAGPRDLLRLRGALERAPELLSIVAELSAGEQGSVRLKALSEAPRCQPLQATLRAALSEEASTDPTAVGVFQPGFDAALDRVVDLAQNGKARMLELEAREREATGISKLKVRHNKVFGYFIEVTKANLRLVPERYIRKQTMVNAERFITEELKALEIEVTEAEERRVRRSLELFEAMLSEVASQVAELSQLSQALAELDVYACFARLAERRGWVRPSLHEGSELEIEEGRHPVLEALADTLGEPFVPNDLKLGDLCRLMILTGPNMAGKSTVMRQTALIVILAHMGAFVPARRARIGRVDRVFTRVGASDELTRGMSTFMVEMTETAAILQSATRRSLILLDEIGRGTSTFDGLSIAWAVAEHLHDQVGALTLFATHYHELTQLARDRKGVINQHIAVKQGEGKIVFLRKLVDGPTERSYGVEVAKLAGLPAGVLRRARQVLRALESEAGPSQAHASLDQLSLFSKAPAPAQAEPAVEGPSEAEREVLSRLRELPMDELSAREALAALWSMQDVLRGE